MQLRFEFGWLLHVGRWPGSCCGTCDKAYNEMEFDGCLARSAAAHFGQGPAGLTLNCVALCLLRHMALRNPAPGERRGDSVISGNGVARVDGFTFHKPCQSPRGVLRARARGRRRPAQAGATVRKG